MIHSGQANDVKKDPLPVITRLIDDILLDNTDGEVRQIVILGARSSTRAYRLPLKSDLKLFELESPEFFAAKKPRLAALGIVPRCHLKYVPTSFHDDWTDDLLAAGFNSADPTIWVAEDFLYHQTQGQVEQILENSRFLSAPGSLFLGDFFGTRALQRASLQSYLKGLEMRGEPPPFCHDNPAELLANHGWKRVFVIRLGPPEVKDRSIPTPNHTTSIGGFLSYIVMGEC